MLLSLNNLLYFDIKWADVEVDVEVFPLNVVEQKEKPWFPTVFHVV